MERIKKLQRCNTRKCYHYKVDKGRNIAFTGVKGAKGLWPRLRVQVGVQKELPKMLHNEDVSKC